MKTKVKKLFLVMMCMALCGVFVWHIDENKALANQTGTVVTSGGVLRMRSGVGTTNSIVTEIPNGSQVTIINLNAGSDANGIWYEVTYNNLQGYVAGKYVSLSIQATASPEATATPTPTPTPTPTVVATAAPVTIYRTETSYKKIKVPAKIKKKQVTIYKNTSGKNLRVKRQNVVLKKNKSVKIIAEKTKGSTKWFKISFKYKKKTRKGYIKSTDVKMTLKQAAAGKVVNVKTALRVRKKPGNSNPYYKVNGRVLVLAKKQYVNIIKVRTVKKKQWYRISFDYYGKTYKGYVQAKYIKLAKPKVQKKVKVTALSDAEFEAEMIRQGFPDSYKDALRKLHVQYPYWQFTAYKTGLDWETAVTAESKIGLNLISNSKSAAWKSMEEGAYDAATGKWKVFDGSTWVAASKAAVSYYMDPRNFLTEQSVYQFEQLEYQSQYQTESGVENVLSNTPFAKTKFTYVDGTTGANLEITYAAAFMAAAKESGVSPYHLASRCKQEVVTGATTVSSAVTGTTESYPGIFNFYNIGATHGTNPVLNGLKWANTGTTFLRPWNDRYRAIVGGGMYIGSNYINRGQNTGYLQKFNVTTTSTYSHQYMANVEAANSESMKTKTAYNGMMDSVPLVFSIPVYENMPATNCPVPQ